MDAGHLVVMAKDWKLVPKQRMEKKTIVVNGMTMNKSDKKEEKGNAKIYTFNVNGDIDKIEHVTTIVSMTHVPTRRGKLRFYIQSPSGTKSMILGTRSKDMSTKGFDAYEFLSMELWDENAKGDWSFIAENTDGGQTPPEISGLDVVIRGTGNDQYQEEFNKTDAPETTKTTTTTTKTTPTTTTKPAKKQSTDKQTSPSTTTTTTSTTTKTELKTVQPTTKTTSVKSTKEPRVGEPNDEPTFDPSERDRHSGFKQLLGYLVIGCLLMFLISNWYVNRNSIGGSTSRDKIQYSPLREKD